MNTKEQIFCIYQGPQCVAIMTAGAGVSAHFTFASDISDELAQAIVQVKNNIPNDSVNIGDLIRNAYLEKGFTVMNVDDVKQ